MPEPNSRPFCLVIFAAIRMVFKHFCSICYAPESFSPIRRSLRGSNYLSRNRLGRVPRASAASFPGQKSQNPKNGFGAVSCQKIAFGALSCQTNAFRAMQSNAKQWKAMQSNAKQSEAKQSKAKQSNAKQS